MRKPLILLFLATATVFSLSACGGGSSSDPLGTDGLTLTDAAGSGALQVNPNGSLALKATVKNASGTAVAGREVSFGFVSNTSGATLTASTANTNGAGEAAILYRAGATAGSDVVRASISNGAKMDVNITVGSPAGAGGRQIALTGSPTSLAAGKNSILTATVTDTTGNPVSGQAVAFSFISNLSGASALSVLNLGLTDASGRAVAVYTAGATTPYTEVQDTVKAEIVGTCTTALILTRTSATAPPATKTLALNAGTSALTAGQSSILTAKVTDTTGNPVSGQVVAFQFLGGGAAPSGATLATLNGGTTDAGGQALAVYTAGAANPTASVQDTVQAGVAGATGVVILTRKSSTETPAIGYRLSLAAEITSLAAGQSTVVTATVTYGSGNPAGGQAVTFAFLNNNSGAVLTTLGGTTDITGRAVAVYTAGANSPTISVQDTVKASVAFAEGAAIITRTASAAVPPVGYRMALAADVTSLAAGQSAVVTATVTDGSGAAAANQTVTFALLSNNSGATLATLSGTTDIAGRAVAVYTAGSNSSSVSVQDAVQAGTTGSTGAVIVTRTASAAVPPLGYRMALTADVTSLAIGQRTFVTAAVKDGSGAAAAGRTVTFALLSNNSGATLATLNGGPTDITDIDGKAVAIYTAGAASPTITVQDIIQAGTTGSTGAVIVTRTAGTAPPQTPATIDLLAGSQQLNSDGATTVALTALVKDSGNRATSGQAVIFTADSGVVTVTSGTTDAAGKATATLGTGGDKKNRTINLTASSGAFSAANTVEVVGTTVNIQGATTLALGGKTTLTLFLKDSSGAGISGKSIALASGMGNTFSVNPVTTGATGQATVEVTAAAGGVDTITATCASMNAMGTLTLTISTTSFSFIAPTAGQEVNIGAARNIQVRYRKGAAPYNGKTVNFTTTRGILSSAAAVTDANGDTGIITILSTTAGPAAITASVAGDTSIQQNIEFVAVTADKMILQATPTTVGPNTPPSTMEKSTITAVVYDPARNLVKNKTIDFELTDVTGGTISPASAMTDSLGKASTVYTSSAATSALDGVSIKATVRDTPAVTETVKLTVGSKAVNITLGTAKIASTLADKIRYQKDYVALVSDAAGNPVANAKVYMNIVPVAYAKGYWTLALDLAGEPFWNIIVTKDGCLNEDLKWCTYTPGALIVPGGVNPTWCLNGILDPGPPSEDNNGNGILDPGGVAVVTPVVTTDANGSAIASITYAKGYSPWVMVQLQARTTVSGSEAVAVAEFILPYVIADYPPKDPGKLSPPDSPFGVSTVCTDTY